ncbi:MAG: FG-GAP-like repeat-containing protein [Balneolaceae bacterium]
MKYKIPILISGMLWLFAACQAPDDDVDILSEEYQNAVSDFYISLAASQTNEARFAFNKMNDVAQAYPKEAAAWANLGVYAMRQGNFDLAEDRLGEARNLEPEHPDILYLSSLAESRRGNISESITYLQRASAADSSNTLVRYALITELERQDDQANAERIRELLDDLNQLIPSNQVVLLEQARISAKEGDLSAAQESISRLREQSDEWSSDNRDQLEAVQQILDQEDAASINLELSFLRSGLEEQPEFREDLRQVQLPPTEVGYLITEFLWLPQPQVRAAEADRELRFEPENSVLTGGEVQWVKGVTLLEEAPPFAVSIQNGQVIIDEQTVLEFPGRSNGILPRFSFIEFDYNYSFRNDLALAGSEGFVLYRQNNDETFTDVTNETGLSAQYLNASYNGVWAFDMDMDGDLDLLLSRESGSPIVFRNNGDDSFTAVENFSELNEIRNFEWADMDGDGVPEAVFLTEAGEVFVFKNLRGGEFGVPETIEDNISAFSVADIDADSQFDIITAGQDGIITAHYQKERTGEWETQPLVDSGEALDNPALIFIADLDNNGAADLLVTTGVESRIWLGSSGLEFEHLETGLSGNIWSLFDINGNERLDLLGISSENEPVQYMNTGSKEYGARSIRARASGTEGDRRINSFGIGGEMEIRSGLLYQKQIIKSPIVHFGLGEYDEAEMLRIIWTNGSVQAEFAEMGMGSTIFNEQILKGSCPWLFTNDGDEIHFITDILWRSPLGLRINAQETAGVVQTMDRVKVPGHQLKPVNGIYDLRITAELWETHFFDHVSLVAVDHPEDTEIFVDERFVFPAPDLSTRAMKTPKPVAAVYGGQGKDVTEVVSENDQKYLVPFNKTQFQGLVEEHTIEIDLGDEGSEEPLWLVLSGWLRPTDSSLNLALSQGKIAPPKGLEVRIADGNGGWFILHEDYGFPAGKLKSILLDLEEVFPDPEDRRIRLTTTSEIYWDAIQYAEKTDPEEIIEMPLEPGKMELRYRGYSEWSRADSTSPKLPYYEGISGTAQRWRDLTGFHTRFGDVSELLEKVDDRYVIMNAGDEMVVQFTAPEEPREGWTRSFVFVSDGWEKDGDYNTGASATVAPLPFHGQKDYDYAGSGNLKNDPVYQQHENDWVEYHTRFITPNSFNKALTY